MGGVREGWERHREIVGAWMEVSPDPNADPELVDGLTHGVISEHQQWSERLAQILGATHHH